VQQAGQCARRQGAGGKGRDGESDLAKAPLDDARLRLLLRGLPHSAEGHPPRHEQDGVDNMWVVWVVVDELVAQYLDT
jgi:hypothetical protein